MKTYCTIEELIGKTIVAFRFAVAEVIIDTKDGTRFCLYHKQDCCESVVLQELVGDIKTLLNEVVLEATQTFETPEDSEEHESVTLTDFTIRTAKGTVVLHWIGKSNGYHSETVEITKETR